MLDNNSELHSRSKLKAHASISWFIDKEAHLLWGTLNPIDPDGTLLSNFIENTKNSLPLNILICL